MRYNIEMFRVQGNSTMTQTVESFKKICRDFAGTDIKAFEGMDSIILPDAAIMRAVIACQHTKKYAKIVADLGKAFARDQYYSNAVLAALSFLPKSTTVSQLMPFVKPFDLLSCEVEQILTGLCYSGKIKNIEITAGLDNIHQ